MNIYQLIWNHLNIQKDKEELQAMIYEFLNWFKWYVNPTMAEKVEQMESKTISVPDDQYIAMVADGFRKEGKTEDEIYDILVETGFINPEQ